MVIHWESSKRPLYIRTVWRDGQHHVVLDKSTETIQQEQSSFRRRSKPLTTTQRSTKSASSVNLNVSSVRVLLSGVKRFRNYTQEAHFREKSTERPKTWNGPICTRQAACKNLNNEVHFETIRGFKPPSLNKSSAQEVRFCEEPVAFNKISGLENTLSEKVMVWLDLANQDGQIEKSLKKEFSDTVAICNLVEPLYLKPSREEFPIENILEDSVLKNKSPREDGKNPEHMVIYSSEEVQTVNDENFYHVLTPRTARNDEGDVENDAKPNYEKRQLHIFMPNLPSKRSSDCDSSLLSSKISFILK